MRNMAQVESTVKSVGEEERGVEAVTRKSDLQWNRLYGGDGGRMWQRNKFGTGLAQVENQNDSLRNAQAQCKY